MKLPQADVQVEYTQFLGGLNEVASAITFPPGALLVGKNYVPTTTGGYERIDGYERYDGQTSPSSAEYTHLEVTFSGSVSNGDTITGSSSGATGVVANFSTDKINVTKVSGTFEAEDITVSGSTVGTITAVESAESTTYQNALAKNAAADIYRDDITKPGSASKVTGLCMLDGTLYAFVDNAAGSAGQIFKATSSGWVEISLYSELSFDTGSGTISDGDDITQDVSGATATVQRVMVTSGEFGTDAAGKLIISSISGTFNNTDAIRIGGTVQAYATSTSSSITISAGGRYSFIRYNFYADLDRKRIYGCDGVNRGFEFDGSVYAPIDVPLSSGVSDTPLHVGANKKQLFFSYRSGVMHSGVGYPYEFSAVSGANFLSLGDTVTGMHPLTGDAYAIFSRNEIKQLVGNNIEDYQLDSVSDTVGAISYTVQQMGYLFCLDDRGIIQVSPTDMYGNFTQGTVSRQIPDSIASMKAVAIASGVYRTKDQYRIYGSDGTGICMVPVGENYEFGYFEYPDNVSCVHCTEDDSGNDLVFFGTDEGWVMQANKGSSFDGEDIEAYFSLPFNNNEAPTTLKTYRKGTVELESVGYTSIKFITTLSYGSAFYGNPAEVKTVSGSGGRWDVEAWDEFEYDAEDFTLPEIPIRGTGLNMSFTIYSKSSIDLGHKFSGLVLHYTPRRLYR